MKNKTFYTLYLPGGDEHIYKDVGQIPYHMSKGFGYQSFLVECNFTQDKVSLWKNPYLRLIKLKCFCNSYTLTGLFFLLRMSRKIDVLNLYHTSFRVWIHSLLYKILHPRGCLYIKLDCGYETCDMIDSNLKYRKYFLRCLELANVITVESRAAKERLMKYDKKRKIKLLYNGYSDEGFYKPALIEKENVFLFVGTVGYQPKATDILLNAFKYNVQDGWRLVIVGEIQRDFESYFKDYIRNNPDVAKYIDYKGIVNDRLALYQLYRKAKAFVLPSYNESYSLASVEALINGCYLILSDRVTPYREFTNNGKYGEVVRVSDINALANAMNAIRGRMYTNETIQEISEYALKKFSWGHICRQMNGFINEV